MTDDVVVPPGPEPEWWRRAGALMTLGRTDEAEAVVKRALQHIGAPASIASLWFDRMVQLQDAGDAAGAAHAFKEAGNWITFYASCATSGGEGMALSRERDAFLAELRRAYRGAPDL